jgi:hypothetical protein
MNGWSGGILAVMCLVTGCQQLPIAPMTSCPRYALEADRVWFLNLPGNREFDASGLMLTPSGQLYTVNDKVPILYRIEFGPHPNEASLIPDADRFSPDQLADLTRRKPNPFDWEGLAMDDEGRIYICEEADRWVLCYDPRARSVRLLDIKWGPAARFFSTDRNASWEGIAVGGGKIYLANERARGVICVFGQKSLRLEETFIVRPSDSRGGDEHYSDLCWFESKLYVLLREKGRILQVEPSTHAVVAEYDCRPLARREDTAFRFWSFYPTTGLEGLAVSRDSFWLVVDNNGFARKADPRDRRPVLYHCPRPDKR